MKFTEKHSDQKLVEALQAGSKEAFEKLYNKYSKKIYNISRKMYLDNEEAENIVQDVFFKIWRNRINLDSQLSFNSYLITIAKSIIIKLAQKKARFVAYQDYSININPSFSIETEDYIVLKDIQEASSRALDELPARQKQVFLLKNSEYLTTDEITSRLGLSKRTVENQLYRATKLLKEKLMKAGLIGCFFMLSSIL